VQSTATPEANGEDTSHFGIWAAALVGAVALWSLSYIARQPGVAATAAPSLVGDFAMEGMALSLAWLAVFGAGCWAVARGRVEVRCPAYSRATD
jgi:hypothetical protein